MAKRGRPKGVTDKQQRAGGRWQGKRKADQPAPPPTLPKGQQPLNWGATSAAGASEPSAAADMEPTDEPVPGSAPKVAEDPELGE